MALNDWWYDSLMIFSLKVTRQMSHQDRRAMMTPKRKCSFSSFSECRYVVDGGKTTTFLFAIETPSPSSQDNDQQTNCKQYHIFMLFFLRTYCFYKNVFDFHPLFDSFLFKRSSIISRRWLRLTSFQGINFTILQIAFNIC